MAAMVGAAYPPAVRGLPCDPRHPIIDRERRLPQRRPADRLSPAVSEVVDLLLLGSRRAPSGLRRTQRLLRNRVSEYVANSLPGSASAKVSMNSSSLTIPYVSRPRHPAGMFSIAAVTNTRVRSSSETLS